MNRIVIGAVLLGGLTAATALSRTMEIETIVDGVYLRDSTQRAQIHDLTMTVESYSRKLTADGEVKEEKKFLKTDYLKDTLFQVHFHQYFLNGIRQDDAALLKEARADADRRRRGRSRDVNFNPVEVFYPEKRSNYEFTLKGVETREGYACYHIIADCLVEKDSLIEGEYWFETEGLNPACVQFHPAKLPNPLKQLDMEMWYAPDDAGRWLPIKFQLLGRGKVMLFIKFNFEVDEKYFDHRINTGLSESFFKETADEK
jgi:hypothetical protein